MTLETDTVDRGVSGLELLDKVLESSRLGSGTFDVVVVDVELGVRVSLSSCLESDGNVIRPEGVVEYICTEGTVIVEGL